jgi:hypothetical protein
MILQGSKCPEHFVHLRSEFKDLYSKLIASEDGPHDSNEREYENPTPGAFCGWRRCAESLTALRAVETVIWDVVIAEAANHAKPCDFPRVLDVHF